jgi:hypothetical protein
MEHSFIVIKNPNAAAAAYPDQEFGVLPVPRSAK